MLYNITTGKFGIIHWFLRPRALQSLQGGGEKAKRDWTETQPKKRTNWKCEERVDKPIIFLVVLVVLPYLQKTEVIK